MHLAQTLTAYITTLLLTYGCGNVESKISPESTAIATLPKKILAHKPQASLPTLDLKKQKSQPNKLAPPLTFKQRSIQSLNGMTSSEILLFLGIPQFKRLDDHAQIWQYRHNHCVLYLFLYPSHNRLTVSHLETLSHSDKHIPQDECFASIVLATRK